MAKSTQPEVVERQTAATTKRTQVRLDEIVVQKDRYCHREDDALTEANLKPLMDSLVSEGLQVPIEICTDSKGQKVLIKGHRRVKSCQILEGKKMPGFTPDMELEALEVVDATAEDLLVRSIADNELRLNLDRKSRIKAAKKLHDGNVPVPRAARSLGVNVKTYERDLLIAEHGWMFQHVIDDSIAPTHAIILLTKAKGLSRLVELKEDLDAWIAAQKRKIREKEKKAKAASGKELRPQEKMVKGYLADHLVEHWVVLLGEGKRFDEDAEWDFAAGIETEKGLLSIKGVRLDLSKAPIRHLARVASKLSQMSKQLKPIITKRVELDKGEVSKEDVPFDGDYLRDMGLEDLANEMEAQLGTSGEDGEEDPSLVETEERTDKDLTDDISVPGNSVAPSATDGTDETAVPEKEDDN